MQLRVAINGAAGRMGQMLVSVVCQDPGCQLVSATEAAGHPKLGKDAGNAAGAGETGVMITQQIEGDPEVLIDFSAPQASVQRAGECAERGVAIVIGTTGFNEDQMEQLKSFSTKVPVLVAPNMSVGVNLMFALASQAAKAVGEDWDIEIIEAHHNKKKDAPSGTANGLAEAVCEALDWEPESVLCHGREGAVAERPQQQVGMHAVRAGDIVGTHTVMLAGDGQTIELTHRAGSRDIFAKGAVRAGEFVSGKEPGFYTMQDVLK